MSMLRPLPRHRAIDAGSSRQPMPDSDDCPIRVSPPLRDLPAGVWPDDPDEVPAWRIAAETKAAIYGYTLPAYRTRREFEAAIGLCESAEEQRRNRARAGRLKPALPPARAAQAFVDAVRSQERAGQYTAAEIYAAYLDHCTGHGLTPLSEKALKSGLDSIPGVTVAQCEAKLHGRRHRPTIWTISAEVPRSRPLKLAA